MSHPDRPSGSRYVETQIDCYGCATGYKLDLLQNVPVNFFVIKPTRCTNFPNLFCHETLHVSDSSSVHHKEFIHCTLSNGIRHKVCRQFSSRPRMELQSHVEFHNKINLQNWCIWLVLKNKFVTMQHGHMNVLLRSTVT
jgi:hypothetical protein